MRSRSRFRAVLAAVVAAFAVSAVSASSASAISWWVGKATVPHEEKELKAGEKAELSETVKTKQWQLSAEGMILVCEGVKSEKGFIEGTNGGSAHALIFSGCRLVEPAGCTLTSKTITTKPLVLVLKEVGGKTVVELKPAEKEIASITFSNIVACGIEKGKTWTITGFTTAEIVTSTECAQEHFFKIEEKPSNLKIGGIGASFQEFRLDAGLTLKSGNCWAAH
jgi:hypothetical protein